MKQSPGQPKNIVLYADDDQDDLALLAEVFSSYPHLQLLTFSGGADMVSYVDQLAPGQQLPCMIILDINMPIMNGWETLEELKKLPAVKDCFFLFLSTSTRQLRKLTDTEKEISIIAKPASLAEMDVIMESIISHCPAPLQEKLRGAVAR